MALIQTQQALLAQLRLVAFTSSTHGLVQSLEHVISPPGFSNQPAQHESAPYPQPGLMSHTRGLVAPLPAQQTIQDPTTANYNIDAGANSHLNATVYSLSDIFNIRIYQSVSVGDGYSILVTNSAHSISPTPHRPFQLNSVLMTPNNVKNLIYVCQFVRDNYCTIEFDAFGFFVKDSMTRQVLLRCDSTGDLYPVTKHSTIPYVFLTNGTLSRYKAHLIANGSTRLLGINVDETFSLVVKPTTIRTVLSLQRTDTTYLLLYVDAIVLTTSFEILLHQIIDSLDQEFSMTDLDSLYYFLGISVARDSSRMFLSQRKYATEIVERTHIGSCNPSRTPFDTESKLGADDDLVFDLTVYKSLAGALRYLTFTRQDIFYAMQQICLYMHDPRERHFSALKRILSVNPLSRSSAEAEYRGVVNAVAETCWLRNLLCKLHTPLSSATLAYYDNASAVYCLLTQFNINDTDIFTKGLPSALFEEIPSNLSVRSPAQTSEKRKATKLEKQMNAKLAWIHAKYNHRSETHIGGSSSQTHEIGDVYLIAEELHQLHLDGEALRETLEEQTIDEKAREDKIRQKQADDDEYFMEFGMMRIDSDYDLDIDDSDLHLTPVLCSSSSAHVEPSPYTSNPVTIIPGSACVVQLSNSICVELSSSTPNPVRIIPGPAGLVQRAKLLKENVFILNPDGVLMSTQEYMQKVVEDVGEDADFNSGVWISATNYVNAFGGTVTGCLGDIDNFLKRKNLNKLLQ
nr:hypothetical protein [Tanacetum cinerariifolium]